MITVVLCTQNNYFIIKGVANRKCVILISEVGNYANTMYMGVLL